MSGQVHRTKPAVEVGFVDRKARELISSIQLIKEDLIDGFLQESGEKFEKSASKMIDFRLTSSAEMINPGISAFS